MVRNWKKFYEFERNMVSSQEIDIEKNIKIFDELLNFARAQGALPLKNPLEGIEIDIKYGRVINGIKGTAKKTFHQT